MNKNENSKISIEIMNKRGQEIFDELKNVLDKKDKEIERLNKEKDYLDDYNRHLHNENKRLNNITNELDKCIKDFLCTKEYMTGDMEAISNNYVKLLNIMDELKEGK